MSRRPCRPRLRRRRLLLVAVATVVLAQFGANPAQAAPPRVGPRIDVESLASDVALRPEQKQALAQQLQQDHPTTPSATQLGLSGPTAFLLELDTPSTAATYSDAVSTKGADAAATDATTAAATIEAQQQQVAAALPQTVPGASVLYTTKAAAASVAVVTDAADQPALHELPNVADVRPIVPKRVANAGSAQTIGSPAAWQALGQQGEGVSVGVVDTGVDYTHAAFGGPGDPAVFDSIPDAGPVPAGLFPSTKVVGGHDFVGDSYNADTSSPDYQPVPAPDPNPLDCEGHGSHVAGSVAGYGVNADGTTYAGPYDETTPLATLSIGPGMAPGADLYALRVFGCGGSTNVVGQAVEWALDPNGDGNPADHLDVLNLSLGSPFGVADDGDAMMVSRAVDAGILVVASAGNSGDVTDIGGSPGAAPEALTVAASVDSHDVLDGYTLTPPVAGVPAPAPATYSVAFDIGAIPDVTAPLTLPQGSDDPTACAPLTGDYTGRILVIDAAGFACGSAAKGGNARAAGAAGFAIVSDDDSLAVGISGDDVIPGLQVTNTHGTAIKQALAAGQTPTITFGASLRGSVTRVDPAQVDQIAEFTSRGKHAAGGAKPDLAAPGQTVFSVAAGTGTAGATNSGTSMAAPVTAGVAALVLGQHPDWTPAEVKADLMNTATHELYVEPGQAGQIYGPARVGAGRIDAAQAVANDVLASVQEDPGVVSASFGPVEVSEPVSLNKTIRVVNKGSTTTTYDVGYEPATELPGVTYTLDTKTVTVAAGETANVVLTLKIDNPTALRKVIDPTMDPQDGQRQFLAAASGRVVLTPDSAAAAGGAPPLRVPVHAAPRPASTLTAEMVGPVAATGATGMLALTGTGVANGQLGSPDAYYSLVSAFEQLGTSPQLPECTPEVTSGCVGFPSERAADLSVVGATTTVPTASDPLDATLHVAIGTHGVAAAPSAIADYGVVVDADGDPATIEGVVWTARLPDSGELAAGGAPTDVLISYVTDAAGNLLPSETDPAIRFLNDLPGSVDSQVFDTDVRVVPVPLRAFPGISEGNPRLNFGVFAVSGYGATDAIGAQVVDGQVTLSDPLTYNAYSPGLFVTSGLGNPAVNLPVSGPGVLPVAINPTEYAANGGGGLLAVFNQNTSDAGRVQSLPVPVPGPIPVTGG